MPGGDGDENCSQRGHIDRLMRIAVRTEAELKGLAQTTQHSRQDQREENRILHKRISDHDEKFSQRLDDHVVRLAKLEKYDHGQDSANRVRGSILAIGLAFVGGGLALLGQWLTTSGR